MQSTINVLWEDYYHTKPLSFWEFVQEFKTLKYLFPCVANALKRFDKASKNFYKYPSEIYVQGAVGIGKSVYCYLVFLYRVYLFLLLKNPQKLMDWAPSVTPSAIIIGPRSHETLKGIIHFIESAGSLTFSLSHVSKATEFRIETTVDYISKGKNQIDFDLEKSQNGEYIFKSKYGNKLVFRAAKSQCDIIGTIPAISYLEEGDYDAYNALITRVNARFGHAMKIMFSTVIVDKYPNNLYSDLLDQTIKEKEYEGNVLVERFVPIFYRDCERDDEMFQIKRPFLINLDTGEVKARKEVTSDEGIWFPFPADWKGMNLVEKAFEDPATFIKDILGLPILSPFSQEYKVTDSLSALQTVRKLIRDYNMQITFGKEGTYLSIPEVNTKIKVY